LDEGAFATLQEDAKKQNVSVNTLLNQLILTYADFDRPMKRFQMIKLPTSTLRSILEETKDEAIIEAGTIIGSDVPRTYILAKWGEITVENCLQYLRTMSNYSKVYEYSQVKRDGNVSVTLSHSFGPKGNMLIENCVKAIFALVGKYPKFSLNDNAVVFELQ
jgi:hypothetical protein